jgi:hypothetical protein
VPQLKRALLVGIDGYDNFDPLKGCVKDVEALMPLLSSNEDESPNFSCEKQTAPPGTVRREELIEGVERLVAPGADIALFFFAGHGQEARNDVVLVTENGTSRDPGVTLSELLGKVQSSKVPEIVILLDCCFSGGAGGVPQFGSDGAMLRSGVSILSASRADQPSEELGGRGLFSMHLCEALAGGASDVLGKVTVAGVYAYLSESFNSWHQRPTFKSNVDRLHDLRLCSPAVTLTDLRRLPWIFSTATVLLPLDPSYEPTAEPHDPEHEQIFAILQKCRAANLVEPVGANHLYYAAMENKPCRLTALGRHYWRMATERRL